MVKFEYHESKEAIDQMRRRREIRMRLQQEANRLLYNPYRFANHIEILDPAVSRYSAMRAALYEHWKPNWPSYFKYAIMTHIPIAILAWRMHCAFYDRDQECRSGKVPYEDRDINRI